MREVLNSLPRRDLSIVDDAMTTYYQDVYDHVLRATEWTESLRDLVATTVETNLIIQGNRMNPIMKKVASWGRDHRGAHGDHGLLRPEPALPRVLDRVGVVALSGLVVILSALLYVIFKRKDWL